MARSSLRRPAPGLLLLLFLPLSVGCSVRGMAVNSLADALSASGDVFASDDDPELIRAATPFALKTMESLLAERPRHEGLLLALAQGFTQYAYAFPETDALLLEGRDADAARTELARALALYVRARDYGLRGLELRQSGTSEELRLRPETAVLGFSGNDVPLLYWTAAAWGAAISTAPHDPALVADFPAVRALLGRALELDPDFDEGALHEAMISIESLPAMMGGSVERAHAHFDRAVQLGHGHKASPYVALALGVAVPAQDRQGFETLLRSALAIDPDAVPRFRLANIIAQKRARHLLQRIDYLFILYHDPERDHGLDPDLERNFDPELDSDPELDHYSPAFHDSGERHGFHE